jgi:hypothetical protein
MRKRTHFLIGLALAAVSLSCCLMTWGATVLFNFDLRALAMVFFAAFGVTFLLCGWGAIRHFQLALGSRGSESTPAGPAATASVFIGIIAALYVLSYSFLSERGAYGPFTAGANGIKDYAWYPLGYLDQSNHWRMLPIKSYFPLWVLDCKYWHDDWTGQSGPRIPAMPEKAPKAASPSP